MYKFGIVLLGGDIMYRIAICDVDEETRKNISEVITEVSDKLNQDVHIFTYTNGQEMLNSNIRYNLIFLEVDLPGKNGITIAKEIREKDHRAQIVFVTNYENYWKKAYRVHAFDYIQKPFMLNDIKRVLIDYYQMINNQQSDVVSFKDLNNDELMIPTNEIIYISCGVKKRQVIVIAKNEDYICKGIINEIYTKLNNFDFFMPHRSHIINLSQVKSYKRNDKILMVNDDEIPLSKGRTNEFEEKISRVMHERVTI